MQFSLIPKAPAACKSINKTARNILYSAVAVLISIDNPVLSTKFIKKRYPELKETEAFKETVQGRGVRRLSLNILSVAGSDFEVLGA